MFIIINGCFMAPSSMAHCCHWVMSDEDYVFWSCRRSEHVKTVYLLFLKSSNVQLQKNNFHISCKIHFIVPMHCLLCPTMKYHICKCNFTFISKQESNNFANTISFFSSKLNIVIIIIFLLIPFFILNQILLWIVLAFINNSYNVRQTGIKLGSRYVM